MSRASRITHYGWRKRQTALLYKDMILSSVVLTSSDPSPVSRTTSKSSDSSGVVVVALCREPPSRYPPEALSLSAQDRAQPCARYSSATLRFCKNHQFLVFKNPDRFPSQVRGSDWEFPLFHLAQLGTPLT